MAAGAVVAAFVLGMSYQRAEFDAQAKLLVDKAVAEATAKIAKDQQALDKERMVLALQRQQLKAAESRAAELIKELDDEPVFTADETAKLRGEK